MSQALLHGCRQKLSRQQAQLAWSLHAAAFNSGASDEAAAAAASLHTSASALQQQQQQQQQQRKLLPEGIIVLPMPSLSHAMERGTVKRWLKQEGELCQEYDLVRFAAFQEACCVLLSIIAT
jgi:hypothetical protein